MSYFTVQGEAFAEYEIQHSVFICSLKGVESFDDGMNYVKTVAKKYSDATHNCYAVLSLSGEQKFSDDGEPQGTAGMPILQTLKKNGLNNVACVVTRYFGGIKLGAGGLVSAYTKSVTSGMEKASVVKMIDSVIYSVQIPYSDYELMCRVLKQNGCIVSNTSYDSEVTIEFYIPAEKSEKLKLKISETFNGRSEPLLINKTYMAY